MLTLLAEWKEALQVFIETGGDVLLVIFAVTLLMWALILERFWYFTWGHPKDVQATLVTWNTRKDRSSWCAEHIRRQQVSELSLKLNRSLTMIKTLVALCPLLGLLGTVTGMIQVFDTMALVGSGNTRAMASSVYMATIPTMSGMVAALSGVYFSGRLERNARRMVARVKDRMAMERGEACAVA